jgi:hypothetical protein
VVTEKKSNKIADFGVFILYVVYMSLFTTVAFVVAQNDAISTLLIRSDQICIFRNFIFFFDTASRRDTISFKLEVISI